MTPNSEKHDQVLGLAKPMEVGPFSNLFLEISGEDGFLQ